MTQKKKAELADKLAASLRDVLETRNVPFGTSETARKVFRIVSNAEAVLKEFYELANEDARPPTDS